MRLKVKTVGAKFLATIRSKSGRTTTKEAFVPLWNVNNPQFLRPYLEEEFSPAKVLRFKRVTELTVTTRVKRVKP
jgi:hypothetical protein